MKEKEFIGSKSISGVIDLELLLLTHYVFHRASLLYPF